MTKTNRRYPCVETLESREVLAANIRLNAAGVLHIRGTALRDTAIVNQVGNQVVVQLAGGVRETARFAVERVQEIVFRGFANADRFTNNTAIRCVAIGGAGNDVLNGGSANDFLDGGAGRDQLSGGSVETSGTFSDA